MISDREVVMLGLIDALVREARVQGVEPEVAAAIANLDLFARRMLELEDMPDTLPAGWNRPAPATTSEVVRALIAAAGSVVDGDSFEGTITWTMPTDEPELEGAEFGLVARWRVGNRDGQGGVRVFAPGDAG